MLERAVSNPEGFSKLFGITTVHDASILAANHPYTLTQVAERVRKNQRWHFADKLIRRVFEETGFDIKASDNKYHRAEKYGKSIIRWYSDAAVSLLKDVYVGKQYEI